MDLPTYTNIWRIEKRLYKLYDLRLPMPLPLGQIAAFVGITVPYVLLLTLIGVPFTHTLFWLYVLPPGVLTWLVTRPVIENKKLPELLVSQVRYLGEPNVWCRMAPSAEKDEIIVAGRVWHACPKAVPQTAAVPRTAAAGRRRPAPAQVHAAGPPARGAPAPGGQRRPAEPRHRKPAAARPQPGTTAGTAVAAGAVAAAGQVSGARQRTAAGQVAARGGQPAGSPPPWARPAGPVPAPRGPAARSHGPAAWPQHREARPAPPAPGRVPRAPARVPAPGRVPPAPRRAPQPEWALRARPGGPPGRRVIEVAHAEHDQPARWQPAETPWPPPGAESGAPGGPPPARVPEPSAPADPPPGDRPRVGGDRPRVGPYPVREPGPPSTVAHAHPAGPVPVLPPAGAAHPVLPPAGDGPRTAPLPSGEVPPGGPEPGPPSTVAHAHPAGPAPAVPPQPAGELKLAAVAPANGDRGTGPGAPPPQPLTVPDDPAAGMAAAPTVTEVERPPAVDERRTAPGGPEPNPAAGRTTQARPTRDVPAAPPSSPVLTAGRETSGPGRGPSGQAGHAPAPGGCPGGHGQGTGRPASLAAVTVRPGSSQERPAQSAGRVLSGPPGPSGRGWHDPATLAAVGHGPGKSPETRQEERDQARACMPLPGPGRIVVLGCTSGAGQTVTALMIARLLARLRAEPVAALDLNPGHGSLTRRSRSVSPGTVHDLLGGTAPAARDGSRAAPGIKVIAAGPGPESVKKLDDDKVTAIGESLLAGYQISLIDPGASAVARVLAVADQLVLVAPASGDAPRAVSMTQDWLAAHDHDRLTANAVLVVNGVSGRSMDYAEQAEAIAAGRFRAIVRVPWEDELAAGGGADLASLRPPARRALTELAGLIVWGLAAPGECAAGEPR